MISPFTLRWRTSKAAIGPATDFPIPTFFFRCADQELLAAAVSQGGSLLVRVDTLTGALTEVGPFTGGEPLMQPTFLIQLLDACGQLRLHRTLDTSGHADTQTVLKVAARTDLFLYDLKHMDPEKHYRYTGVSNETILTNLQRLDRQGARIIIRFPLIPDINTDEENIDRMGALASSLPGVIGINILPYHGAAEAKYRNLGLKNHAADVERPSGDVIASIARQLESYDLEVKIGG